MRALWLGLSVSMVFVAGSIAGGFGSRLIPAAHAAEPSPVLPREKTYYCFEEGNADAVTVKANAAAARGWELTSAGPGSSGAAIWCFRRAR
jgi:hypothetical protein